MGTMTDRKPWEWRKAWGGFLNTGDTPSHRRLHAYDVNSNAACDVHLGLASSVEEPNEGSELCEVCIEVIKAQPEGREKRIYPPESE